MLTRPQAVQDRRSQRRLVRVLGEHECVHEEASSRGLIADVVERPPEQAAEVCERHFEVPVRALIGGGVDHPPCVAVETTGSVDRCSPRRNAD